MQLSQSALFRLSCASFVAGLLLALLCDILYMTRLWLTPSNIRYTASTIQRLRTSRVKQKNATRSNGLRLAIFFDDILFCLVCAITLILLLYWLNNGAFRAAAPLCMATGFWIWHIGISKGVRVGLQWLAFAIETVLYTLLIPIKRLVTWIVKVYKSNAQRRHLTRLTKVRKAYTKQELQSIDKAAEWLLPIYSKSRMQKGDNCARKNKKAV